KAQENGEAADARLRVDGHAAIIGRVEHPDVQRKASNERSDEHRGEGGNDERRRKEERVVSAHPSASLARTCSSDENATSATPASERSAVANTSGYGSWKT